MDRDNVQAASSRRLGPSHHLHPECAAFAGSHRLEFYSCAVGIAGHLNRARIIIQNSQRWVGLIPVDFGRLVVDPEREPIARQHRNLRAAYNGAARLPARGMVIIGDGKPARLSIRIKRIITQQSANRQRNNQEIPHHAVCAAV